MKNVKVKLIKQNTTEILAGYWYELGETYIYNYETFKKELLNDLDEADIKEFDLVSEWIEDCKTLTQLRDLYIKEDWFDILDMNISEIYTLEKNEMYNDHSNKFYCIEKGAK